MTKTLLRSLLALAICAGLPLFSGGLYGQAISGDLTGLITDASGAGLPAATVEALNENTGVRTNATVNGSGVYRISNLPVGSYTLTATASGFSTGTVKGVMITLSNTITQNITLQVGTSATTVDVTEAAPAIDTTTAQLFTSFEAKQIQELPNAGFSKTINGSGIWNLSLLGAGVSSQGGVGQGTGPAIAGQRPEDNTFFVDGVSNNNHYSTGPLVYVSNESIAEMSLLQNQFSAEFGGASGGVFNAVVKSGTNKFHGSLYEYFQNRNLNAVDALTWTQGLTSNPRYDNNKLGASIGGPILKNKLFFFGNMEYNPLGQSSVPGAPLWAPTAAGYTILGSIPGLSTTNLGVFKQYVPAAPVNNEGNISVSGVKVPVGDVSFVNPTYTNSYNALVSIDYNLSAKDQIRGRWIYNKSEGLESPGPNLPQFFVNSPNNNYLLSISEFHNFTPTLQNEFRSSFSRNVNSLPVPGITFPGLNVFPVIQIDELNGIALGPDGPSGSIQNLFQLQDNLSKIWGRHSIKIGYHFTDVILTNYFIQRVLGNYEYSTFEQYLKDLTPDVLGERSAGPTSYPAGFLQNEAFVNDDFRIRPNLTLNLGLRYEYVTIPVASRYQVYSSPANVPGGITFAEPKPSGKEWSPRIGFAYAPGKEGLWSFRGGFSRAFDLTYANLTSNAAPPYFQQTNDVDLSSNAPNFLKNGGLSGAIVPLPTNPRDALAVVGSYTYGGKRPYGLTWTGGVQRVLAKNYTLEVRYVGTKGVHLWNQTRSNVVAPVTQNNSIPTYFSLPSAATLASLPLTLGQLKSTIVPGGTAAQPYNNLASLGSQANIVGYAPQAYSQYNGLAIQLNKRFSNNVSFIAAYTWSHLIDDGTATNFSTYLTPRRAQDFQNLAIDKASSALDRRQRFTFTPTYDFKPFQSRGWFVKNVVGNWNLAGTYTYETPEYATVQSGLDSNLNNDSAGDRTVVNPAGAPNVGSGVTGYNALGQAVASGSSSIVAYVANNPNARYVVAGAGAFPNGGRNTFPLHPTNNVDLSVTKRFNVKERYRMDFGAQFFNLFNHAQYTGGYVSDVSSNGYTGSRNDLIPNNPAFGRFDQFYSSNSRNLQLFARFTF
jgi:Carboxypeptidase regulatory-like domain/TonB-dependent Receptor Plug Domain